MFIQVLYNDDNSNNNDNSIHNNNNGNLAVNNPSGDFYWSWFPVQQDIWGFFCFHLNLLLFQRKATHLLRRFQLFSSVSRPAGEDNYRIR